jgi:VCBS repeat-containing protein
VTDADGVPAGAEDTFTYAITDGDGDVSYAQLVIDVDQDTRVPTIGDVAESVNEAGLDFASLTVDDFEGTNPAADSEKVLNGDLNINANGETFTLFVGATEIVADGTVIAGAYGTLTIDKDGTYTYVLNVEADHQADPTPTDEFAIKVVDATGDQVTDTLVIAIVDDEPIARDDTDHVAEALGSTTSGNVFTGAGDGDSTLVADTIGADGPDGVNAPVTGFWTGADNTGTAGAVGGAALQGTYGTLQLNANGSYTYTVTDADGVPAGAEDTFTYAITDGDGDVSYAQLVIDVDQDTRVPDTTGSTATVYEDGLADGLQHGAASETATGTFTVDGNNEGYTLTLDGDNGGPVTITAVGNTVTTTKGVLQITSISAPDAGGVVTYGYSYTLSAALTHTGQGEVNPLSDTITMSVTDATGDSDTTPASIVISIVDDIPEIIAQDLAVYRVTGVTSGNYDFNVGADNAPFPQSFAAPALTWTNVPDGYTFALKPGTTATYQAQFVEDGVTKTYFEITIKADGTYDFNLVDAAPSVSVPSGNLLSGISGGSGLPSYTIPASTFGGAFSIVITGTNNGNADTLTISSTDLGVGDNVVHKNGDVLKFDLLQQAGYETSTLSTMTFSVASAGIAAGDDVSITVRYTDGTTQTFNEEVTAGPGGSMQLVVDGFNASKTVDYVTIDPVDSNMKITGVALSYTTTINPADQLLNFQLTGTDADGDKASDAFTVTVMAGTSGDDNITTGSSNDQVSGGAGNDTLNGGAGNDVLIGGTGNDVLNGGTGSDTASYSDSATPVRINLDDSGNAATDTASLTPANGEVGGAAFGDDSIGIENLTGGSAGDYLAGNSSSNVLMGLGGDDFLFGENGNDILNGGSGQDTMTGGAGADTFVVSADAIGGSINDIISDFTIAQGDQIDLSELLKGLAAGTDLEAGGYVKIEQTGVNTSTVSVDVDGGGNSYQAVAELQNLTYNSATTDTVKILFEDNSGTKHTDNV